MKNFTFFYAVKMQNAALIQVVVPEVLASVVFLAYVEGWRVPASTLVSVGVVGFLQSVTGMSFGFFLTSVFTSRDQVRNFWEVGPRSRELAFLLLTRQPWV